MSRSKYINTFNTTAEYENYIESAYPEFPNVGYDKEAGKVNIVRTSPNDHLIYGTLSDTSVTNAVWINNTNDYGNNGTIINVHNDSVNNTFYLDISDLTSAGISSITSLICFRGSLTNNVTSFKKISFDTSNVTSMNFMFQGCSSLTSLDLSNFNTSNVTNMNGMFQSCSLLTLLDLSNFNTSNVTTIDYMLNGMTNLRILDLSNCNFSNVTSQRSIFINTGNITDVYITVESTLMKLTNNLTSQGTNYIPSSATIHYNDVDYKWQNNAWTPQS